MIQNQNQNQPTKLSDLSPHRERDIFAIIRSRTVNSYCRCRRQRCDVDAAVTVDNDSAVKAGVAVYY